MGSTGAILKASIRSVFNVDRPPRAEPAVHVRRAGAAHPRRRAAHDRRARRPTSFPNIDIPVVTVVWNYGGLSAEEMANRIVSIFERGLTTTVNDIEHIESQSLRGIGGHQGLLPAGREDRGGGRAGDGGLADRSLRQMPPGTTPPFIITYNASTRADPAARRCRATRPLRSSSSSTSASTSSARSSRRCRARRFRSLRRQAAADPGGPRSRRRCRRRASRRRTSSTRSACRT